MLLIGLTGSIATGKSTVSHILRAEPYNLPIIDADLLARKVVEPGTPGYDAILLHFAASTPDLLLPVNDPACQGLEHGPTGKGRPLNRPALGRRVFGSHDEKKKQKDRHTLNSIVHPAVRREMWKAMAWAYVTGHWAVVLDIPLLYESGWERLCGSILVVSVSDPIVQMERLMDRDPHLSEQDAEGRVASQMDVRDKAERCLRRGDGAGVVVLNDKGKEVLQSKVAKAMNVIRAGSPRWWGWLLLTFPPLAMCAATWNYLSSWWIQRAWEEEKMEVKAKL
ncbi:MAG: hypothetical protein M1831_001353 [Alyxoria varia]|nr:MAG: hypothetical protein M1831_001353 [Alyxoria varia]